MSVMACDRKECTHIMCDRCILGNTKYICTDCYNELCEYKDTWEGPMMAKEVEDKIREFMKTPPGTFKVIPPCDIEEEFNRLTGGYRYDS